MEKYNHYTERYAQKTTEELKAILDNADYSEEAQMAAIWELEKRDALPSEEPDLRQRMSEKMAANRERKHGYRRYKTFWPRVLAAFIDGMAIAAMSVIIVFISTDGSFVNNENLWYHDLIDLLVIYGYSVFMHGKYGQTIGKMAMNLKVLNHRDETAIDFRQALRRDMVPIVLIVASAALKLFSYEFSMDFDMLVGMTIYLGSISFVWTLAEILTMLTNDKSRAVHDFIARTVVVNNK